MKLAVGILVVLGLLASGAAVLLVKTVGERYRGETQEKVVDVLVAQTDLLAQTKLTEEHVEVAQTPAKGLPGNYLTDPTQVAGAKLRADVTRGQPLTADLITREMTVADLLHDGMRGFGLSLSRRETGVGLVRPGSVVDLHVTFPIRDREIGESLVIAPLLVQLPVLAVDGETVLTPSEVTAAKRATRSSNVEVMLEVTDEQASVLQLAQKGKVALPLRKPTDTDFGWVQPMILKDGRLKAYGEPVDPNNPAGLLGLVETLTALPLGQPMPEAVREMSDPCDLPTIPVFEAPVRHLVRPTRTTVEVIKANKREDVEVKDIEAKMAGDDG